MRFAIFVPTFVKLNYQRKIVNIHKIPVSPIVFVCNRCKVIYCYKAMFFQLFFAAKYGDLQRLRAVPGTSSSSSEDGKARSWAVRKGLVLSPRSASRSSSSVSSWEGFGPPFFVDLGVFFWGVELPRIAPNSSFSCFVLFMSLYQSDFKKNEVDSESPVDSPGFCQMFFYLFFLPTATICSHGSPRSLAWRSPVGSVWPGRWAQRARNPRAKALRRSPF